MQNSPKRILFLDVTAPKPYDFNTLQTEPQGGTESTVTRIAEGLAARGHAVTVEQRVREHTTQSTPVIYKPESVTGKYDAVIALRSPGVIPQVRSRWPDAKPFLWLHDFNQNEVVASYEKYLKGTGTKILCVSRTHKTQVASEMLTRIGLVEGVTVDFIYNPIADDLQPDAAPIDKHKLVFFSSPHKGLDHALYLFGRLQSFDPAFKLCVANPGYVAGLANLPDGCIDLGKLAHPGVLQEVRSALAVFHPNAVFPETFGLVHAEANALGVPVLTSPLGANREVIQDANQIVNVRDEKAVIDKLLAWRDARPVVSGKPEFRLSTVLDQWEEKIK
jgi:glycosyltransferase involved in cell wall biosynthesis